MRLKRFSQFLLVSLVLSALATAAIADTGKSKKDEKRPKNAGILNVKTSPGALPVKINGVDQGVAGVGTGRDFYLAPGFHTLEITAPDGKIWKQEIEIRRGQKHCVCLKTVENRTEKACPYRFHLEGPERINEGDLVTFAAIPEVAAAIPLIYGWRVTPDAARVTSGLGTPTITVDSTGMGGQTINAELDVNDDVYDNKCRQIISVPTEVVPVQIVPPPVVIIDEFVSRTADDDKARIDNGVIQASNIPDSQLYMIIYPGTDRVSRSRNSFERVSKRVMDYVVKNRGFDPSRVQIVRGTEREQTTIKMYVVPPGASLPTVQ